ncbi:MAG: DnaD domain protein [Chloroflexota bacterium]
MQQTGFIGFPDVKMKPVIIPDLFFNDLLPLIDDLTELKLTLYCFWLLNTQDGQYRYLRGEDLRNNAALLQTLSVGNDLRLPIDVLNEALERVVARNTLLKLAIEQSAGEDAGLDAGIGTPVYEDWYFMNTPKGRQAIAMIRQGKLHELQAVLPDDATVHVDRPNIFVLYEQNIGMMTPLIADQLRDMEKTYPPNWIDEAFDIAVGRNKRALRYIQSVLKRWETEGKNTTRHESNTRYPKSRDTGSASTGSISTGSAPGQSSAGQPANAAANYAEPPAPDTNPLIPDDFADIIIR